MDAWGEAHWEEGVWIRGRRQGISVSEVNGRGREAVASGRYWLDEEVGLGDMLDGEVVVSVERKMRVHGVVAWWDVRTHTQ